VASPRWGGGTAPGDTIQAPGDNRIKLVFLWLNLERTLDKRHGKMGVVTRQHLKNVISFQREITLEKVSQFFQKNRVTPSVAAPGFTNPSDATDHNLQ